MKSMKNVRCSIGHHEPNRRKVKWNGLTYVSQCAKCGARLERHGHKDWREVGQTEPAWRLSNQLQKLTKKADDAVVKVGAVASSLKLKGLIKGRSNQDRRPRLLVRRSADQ